MTRAEHIGLPLFSDPMVAEANVWDASAHVVLSDAVLHHQHRFVERQIRQNTLLSRHLRVMQWVFPEVATARSIPQVWQWRDLVDPVTNVGTVDEASEYVRRMQRVGVRLAYITGGLEFTQGQLHAIRYLFRKGYRVIMGHEPYVYASDKGMRWGALTESVVPMSYWSRVLGRCGFLFTIPRPLPDRPEAIDAFYDGLYRDITGRKVPIVVSEHDPFKDTKRRRGPVIEVPLFSYPSTTQLWRSVVNTV